MSEQRVCRKAESNSWSIKSALAALLAGCAMVTTPAHAEVALSDVDLQLDQPETITAPAAGSEEPLPSLLASVDLKDAPGALGPEQADEAETGNYQPRLSFGDHLESVKWEVGGAFAYMTLVNLAKIANRGKTGSFSFQNEGLFGKDTHQLGVDKLAHAHNSYVLSELIGARIRKKTGTTAGTAVSGALLASSLMLYSEIYDGFKAGFDVRDLLFNSLGAGFSVVRNVTPGLEEKLDFRVLLIPNDNIYSPTGRSHYRQLRYLFALELAGFEPLRETPLRYLELHGGYYAKGFTPKERERGEPIERKLFAGVGVNLNELFFGGSPKSRAARAASQVLDYWQPPYTYVHAD